MKILAGNLKELSDALGSIVKTIPLELDAAYRLIEIADKVGRGYQAFEARRIPLLSKFGKKNEDGSLDTLEDGSAQFDGDNEVKFAQAYSKLANEDIEFDFEPISLDLLKLRANGDPYTDDDGKPIRILPQLLGGLLPIIETGDGETE